MKHRWFFVLRVDCLKDSKQSAFKFICVCAVRVRVYAAKASLFLFSVLPTYCIFSFTLFSFSLTNFIFLATNLFI